MLNSIKKLTTYSLQHALQIPLSLSQPEGFITFIDVMLSDVSSFNRFPPLKDSGDDFRSSCIRFGNLLQKEYLMYVVIRNHKILETICHG